MLIKIRKLLIICLLTSLTRNTFASTKCYASSIIVLWFAYQGNQGSCSVAITLYGSLTVSWLVTAKIDYNSHLTVCRLQTRQQRFESVQRFEWVDSWSKTKTVWMVSPCLYSIQTVSHCRFRWNVQKSDKIVSSYARARWSKIRKE